MMQSSHSPVRVAHVRPTNHWCPDDRQRAMCPEGARHGEPLRTLGVAVCVGGICRRQPEMMQGSHSPVGVAHVRPANHWCPDDRQRARHGEPLRTLGVAVCVGGICRRQPEMTQGSHSPVGVAHVRPAHWRGRSKIMTHTCQSSLGRCIVRHGEHNIRGEIHV